MTNSPRFTHASRTQSEWNFQALALTFTLARRQRERCPRLIHRLVCRQKTPDEAEPDNLM